MESRPGGASGPRKCSSYAGVTNTGPQPLQGRLLPLGQPLRVCFQDPSLMGHGTQEGLYSSPIMALIFTETPKDKVTSKCHTSSSWQTELGDLGHRTFCFSVTTRWNKLWVLHKLYLNTKKAEQRKLFVPSGRSMATRISGPPSIFYTGMIGKQYDKL